mmetsp:Transcript_92977/g.277524  ORF Transcript_92977/g.277524 Transcript_92977/m.277524 type:complete len:379 (+) Transcript_92977:879-2015(+)
MKSSSRTSRFQVSLSVSDMGTRPADSTTEKSLAFSLPVPWAALNCSKSCLVHTFMEKGTFSVPFEASGVGAPKTTGGDLAVAVPVAESMLLAEAAVDEPMLLSLGGGPRLSGSGPLVRHCGVLGDREGANSASATCTASARRRSASVLVCCARQMSPWTDSCKPMYWRCISSPSFFMLATHPLTIPRRLTARLGSFSSTASLRSASTSCPTCWATSAYCDTTFAACEKRSRACQKVVRMASESSVSACRKARQAISREPAMETCSFSSSLRQKMVSCSGMPPAVLPVARPSPTWIDDTGTPPGYCSAFLSAFRSCEGVCSMWTLPSEWCESSLAVDGCVTRGTAPLLLMLPLETSVTMGPGGRGDGVGRGTTPPASQG